MKTVIPGSLRQRNQRNMARTRGLGYLRQIRARQITCQRRRHRHANVMEGYQVGTSGKGMHEPAVLRGFALA